MSNLWTSVVSGYSEIVYKNSDARVKDWPLVYSPWVTTGLCLAYFIMCWLGPKAMASRKALELKYVLVAYNLAMVALSFYICKELVLSAIALRYTFVCDQVEYKSDPEHMRLAAAIWLYYLTKLVEFLDTAFFILRKKNSQITFLHVYHHSSIFFLWWIAVKWFSGGLTFLSPALNSVVHILMYSYYGLSVFPSLRKYLWWKKYLTMIQLGQFLFIIVMIIYNLSTGCDFDRRVQWAAITYLTTQCLLFMNFYSKSYGKKKVAEKKTDSHSETKNGNHIETDLHTDSHHSLRRNIGSSKDGSVVQKRVNSKLG